MRYSHLALCSEVAEAIPGAEYQTLASGHFLPVNTPDLWAETVLPFFDR